MTFDTQGNLLISSNTNNTVVRYDSGVVVVVKQHGGKTGTGEACAAITRLVADEGVKVC